MASRCFDGLVLILGSAVLLFVPISAAAQSYSSFEVGAAGSFLFLTDPISGTDGKIGFGSRVTYNFSPIISLEAEGLFFPGNPPTEPQRGGRAFSVLVGPKTEWRFHRVGIFATARPGILNFSNAQHIVTGIAPDGIPFVNVLPGGHHTDLALNLGGGVALNTSRRTFLRFDVGEVLVRYKQHFYPIPTTSVVVDVKGVVSGSLLVSAGFGYRLGDITERHAELKDALRWEVGAQFGMLSMGRAETVGVSYFDPFAIGDDPGFGGRLTYNYRRWLAFDSTVNYFYQAGHYADAQRGGKILQGTFGPKAGLRTQRAGFFLKVRPGFLSYGAVHDDLRPPYPTTRLTHFALDLGAVIELYPSARTMLRFDIGHTIGFFGPRTVTVPTSLSVPTGVLHSSGFRDNGMQFTTGFGWRF